MNSRYFFLMVMLLNLLLPVYGNDDTVQVNDTTMHSNDTTYVECICVYLDDPVITPTECKERIIAHGDTLAYDTLKYYFDLGKDQNRWDIIQRYTFILSDKFDYTLAKLDMYYYFANVYSAVGKMRMDTIMWNCIFDYAQVCVSRNKNMAIYAPNNKYKNRITCNLVDTLSRYDTIVTPIEPQDSVAYRVFCQDQLVNFYIPQDQQPNYEDNLSYALIMVDKYHYPKAYADVYKYIVNIYKSNDMTMPPAMQKLAFNFLRKGVALNDSTALAEMSNLQDEQGLNHANESDETIYGP